MVDQLFRYSAVVRRHRDGPFADERATYLAGLANRGSATETLRKYARYCLAIAHVVVQATPPNQSVTASAIDGLASDWAAARVHDRRAAAPRRTLCEFRAIATTFLKSLGRLTPPQTACPHARELEDFVAEPRDQLRSSTTCHVRRWQIERFLSYLGQTNCE